MHDALEVGLRSRGHRVDFAVEISTSLVSVLGVPGVAEVGVGDARQRDADLVAEEMPFGRVDHVLREVPTLVSVIDEHVLTHETVALLDLVGGDAVHVIVGPGVELAERLLGHQGLHGLQREQSTGLEELQLFQRAGLGRAGGGNGGIGTVDGQEVLEVRGEVQFVD